MRRRLPLAVGAGALRMRRLGCTIDANRERWRVTVGTALGRGG